MRTFLIALLLSLISIPSVWAGVERSQWRAQRPVILPEMSGAGLVYLPLDEDAISVDSYSEFRIVNRDDTEIPYRMIVEEGETETRVLEGRITNLARLDDSKAQVTLDLDNETEFVKRIDLNLKGNNFRCEVLVEVSEDREQWWTLSKGGLVYRHEGRYEEDSIDIRPHTQRYIRITLTDKYGKLPEILSADAIYTFTIPSNLVALPAEMSQHEDTKAQATMLEFDFGQQVGDLAKVELEIDETAFDRRVAVEVPGGAEGEFQHVAGGQLRRVRSDQKAAVDLKNIGATKQLRLKIENGNDPPLTIAGATIYRVRRGLIFAADPKREYRLLYGRADTEWPDYEIQRLPMKMKLSELPVAGLSPEGKIARVAPPQPWSESHPALFWGTLLAVLVVLMLLVMRAARRIEKPDQNG